MKSFWHRIRDNEKGQALPAVLALLALGGLTIASSLNYAATSINSERMLTEGVRGLYAADAGIEDTIWSLGKGIPPPAQLQENINLMQVTIQSQAKGTYTLYLGELVEPGVHNDYLDIQGEITWDANENAYRYILTVTWQPTSGTPVIHLEEIGARLPPGYYYKQGSASKFENNLSKLEPDEIRDKIGVWMDNWTLRPPLPSVSENNTTARQIFHITGQGPIEGNYAWVVANREDIGAVSEITGSLYTITATARRPESNRITARIVADVMIADTTYITTWQILR